jgi:transposase
MLTLPSSLRVFAKTGPTDMRKSFEGLVGAVERELGQQVESGDLLLFFNRRGDRVKALWFAGDGLVIWYKRLEGGTFEVPKSVRTAREDGSTAPAGIEMRWSDLTLILEGIELDFNPPRTPHFKGAVESFFDGLGDQLSASLPGRTFRNWADRADYRPDDGPLLTYEALLEILHIYLVDVYSIAKHPASESTRLEMWQQSAARHWPMLPAAADDRLAARA